MSTVKTYHPKYEKMLSTWSKSRAAFIGQKAVHEGGEEYLPRLKDQERVEYEAYKTRASFYNASKRTLSALSSMLFRKTPQIEVSDSVEDLLENVTLDGTSFHVFCENVSNEVLQVGRVGILVEHSALSENDKKKVKSLADAQQKNLRPTIQKYVAESIINWKVTTTNSSSILSLVVLSEETSIEEDEFEHKSETRYRVLDLLNGVYRQRVFRINDKGEDEQIGSDIIPVMNGVGLNFIPFYFIGISSVTSKLDNPPLLDLINLNFSHYRLNADYFHGLHFTGLPTPVVSGYTPANRSEKLYIGSTSAWIFTDPQASATFLEFTGQGLTTLEKALDKTEMQMAILGARMLATEKKDTETAQTAQIHRASEDSVLSSIAQTLSIGLTEALKIFSLWAGSKEDVNVEINREFLPMMMSPQELTALFAGWQMGVPGLSDQSMFDILQRREVISEDLNIEEEQERIASSIQVNLNKTESINEQS